MDLKSVNEMQRDLQAFWDYEALKCDLESTGKILLSIYLFSVALIFYLFLNNK